MKLKITDLRAELLEAVRDGRARVDILAVGAPAWVVDEPRYVTAALRKLRSAGLVELPQRVPSSGRTVVPHLTPSGFDALAAHVAPKGDET